MATINKNELTKEQMEKAMACKTVEELMAFAKAEGFELTREEAEAFLAEGSEVDLSEEELAKTAGGGLFGKCPSVCNGKSCPGYFY